MADCPSSVKFIVEGPSGKQATYTIEFLGITVQNGNSTWCYKVTVEGDPALSHWVLGVCPKDKIISVTRDGVSLQKYEIGTFHGISGIKFDDGVKKEDGSVTYCITLNGVYKKEPVDVAVKGGPNDALTKEDAICGPSCEEDGNGGNGGNGDKDEIADLIESIALQEAGLAHIINAEGEKIQAAIEKYLQQIATYEDLIAINKSVEEVLTKVINMEMILEFKLEEVIKLTCKK